MFFKFWALLTWAHRSFWLVRCEPQWGQTNCGAMLVGAGAGVPGTAPASTSYLETREVRVTIRCVCDCQSVALRRCDLGMIWG